MHPTGAAPRNLPRRQVQCARSARAFMPGPSPTVSRIDKDDIFWAIDKARHDRQINPAGRVSGYSAAGKNRRRRDQTVLEHCRSPWRRRTGCPFSTPTWPGLQRQYPSRRLHSIARRQNDKNGDWMKSWGTKGTGPGSQLPHSICDDRHNKLCRRPHQPEHPGLRYRGKSCGCSHPNIPPLPGPTTSERRHPDRREPPPR